jgi:hypothetical protein
MREHRAENDNEAAYGRSPFDYSAPAEIFVLRARSMRGRATGYRRFTTAAEAIRFAVEEIPEPLLIGAVMEVREERFDHMAIRDLYGRAAYPLERR